MGAKGFNGRAAKVTKLFTGRGKTRPIPRVVDSSDITAAKVVAIQQTPRTSPTKAALGPRPSTGGIFGSKANSSPKAGTYNPPSVNENI